jgi:hypothetical protein
MGDRARENQDVTENDASIVRYRAARRLLPAAVNTANGLEAIYIPGFFKQISFFIYIANIAIPEVLRSTLIPERLRKPKTGLPNVLKRN